jgi:hypothetical protein
MLQVNQLTGFGAGGNLTTLTQVLSASDNDGAAFTLPIGIQAGDLIVVLDMAGNSGGPAPSAVTPAGFTNAINAAGAASRTMLSFKIANGTEGGTSVNGMNGEDECKLTYVFRGDRPITAASAFGVNSQVDVAGNPSPQVVAALGGVAPLIVLAGYGTIGLNFVDPRTFSPAKDGEIAVLSAGGALDMWLAYKAYNSAPANVTVDMDDEGLDNLVSCGVQCA